MRLAVLVFVGGGIGAIARALFMRFSSLGLDGFPLDILLANLSACLLLGLVAAARAQGRISDPFYLFMATGILGGLSTFSSFAYGAVVLMSGSIMDLFVAVVYVLASLVLGYLAMLAGSRLGKAPG